MSLINLLPAGVLQLVDVLENGYWHARNAAFLDRRLHRGPGVAAAARRPGFILLGIVPMVVAASRTYLARRH